MSNIKIIGQILDTEIINRYNIEDENLLSPMLRQETFGGPDDYIEYFIHDVKGNILDFNYDYKSYKLPHESYYSQSLLPDIEIDPINDVQNLGYQSGEISSRYNFFRKIIGDPFNEALFIQQISSDRTEIRVNSTTLSDDDLLSITSNFVEKQNSVDYHYYFLLNFGENKQVIVINVLSNVTENGEVSILFKLYEPLPLGISLKNKFWIVEEITNPYVFDINLDKLIIPLPTPKLNGPNFNINLPTKRSTSTPYNTYSQLISFLTGSYYRAILNATNNQKSDINIDYSKCHEFSHYGSVVGRLNNFIYKIGEIESYQQEIDSLTPFTSSNTHLINSVNIASSSIDNIVGSFDGFESYLYFTSSSIESSIIEYKLESGSYLEHIISPYPKIDSDKPYNLHLSSSNIVQSWYEKSKDVSTSYDLMNKDILTNTIPSYILDDEQNYKPYLVFVNLIGQHFDNIWVYIDKLSNLWDNDNNLDNGISRNLLYDWLQSFGIRLYSGYDADGILDYGVGSYEGDIQFNGDYSPSSSFLNNVPKKELILDLYKRIYHNLPYLFKSKGSYGGLKSLINIFGITGSILSVKEYGGNLDFQDIQGYNNDKIVIQDNKVKGNILSSIKRLETPLTSSREIRNPDVNFVDISFSPQNQINKAVSSSITSVSSSWIIDDFIGDPRDKFNNTYPQLDKEREHWFSQTFDTAFDYAGFIRLIKFFDNSLFKMVQDFTPARSNTFVGVSIKSPVLERPKIPQVFPTFTATDDNIADIEGCNISPIYDSYYNFLEGDKEAYYKGNITGSYIDVYDYFEKENKNPFLSNNNKGYTPPGFLGGDSKFILETEGKLYEQFFYNSDFNSLHNNVSSNIESIYRKKLIQVMSTDNMGRSFPSYSISESIELQDSNLSLFSHVKSRYEGVSLYGRNINSWVPGDYSYGQSPVINHNVKKLGLFTEIADNIYLPNKSKATLKYLVDENGKLTELNKRNRNWEEVQNTFKTGDSLNISLFDPQKYSNQHFTDGNKRIHESGYSYYPTFYMYGNESLHNNFYAVFTSPEGDSQNILDRYFSISSSYGTFIASSATFTSSSYNDPTYEVWDLWNNNDLMSSRGKYFFPGLGPGLNTFDCTSSYYSVPEKTNYQFTYDFKVKLNATAELGSIKHASASMAVWLHSGSNNEYSAPLDNETKIISFTGKSYNAILGKPKTGYYSMYAEYTGEDKTLLYQYRLNVYNTPYDTEPLPEKSFLIEDVGGLLYKKYKFTAAINPYTRVLHSEGEYVGETNIGETNVQNLGTFWVKQGHDINLTQNWPNVDMYSELLLNSSLETSDQFAVFRKTINVSSDQISIGDKISFRFFINNNNNQTEINSATMEGGILKAVPSQGSTVIQGIQICFDQPSNAFVLNKELSPFFGPSYYFDPLNSEVSSSYSNLYSKYGNINYPFGIEENDKIVIQAAGETGPILEYTVDRIAFQGEDNLAYIYPKEDIDGYFYSCGKFHSLIFLKRIIDETSVVINLKKPTGKTSYGFAIPQNIQPEIIDNIDNINKNVNKQLIIT